MHLIDGPGHVNNTFVSEDAATNRPPTEVTPAWLNAVQAEPANVIVGAGLALDKNDNGQLLKAIRILTAGFVPRLAVVPAARIVGVDGLYIDEIYVKGMGEMVWTATAYFTGYRSPLCGMPMDGHTTSPLLRQIDATGGLVSKTAYAGLWAYAQENGLTVTQTVWTANRGAHFFVDVDAANFRVPDLRDMFRRYTGTDADTANARTLGSYKADAMQGHWHGARAWDGSSNNADQRHWPAGGGATIKTGLAWNILDPVTDGINGTPRTGKETRPVNTAYHPRIHA